MEIISKPLHMTEAENREAFKASELRRASDAWLSRRDRFFIVHQRYFIGPPIRQWVEHGEYIDASELADAVRALPGIDGPIEITFVDRRSGTSADVSKQAALMVAERIRDGEFSLTDDLRNFIEEHHGVGSVIPAAA